MSDGTGSGFGGIAFFTGFPNFAQRYEAGTAPVAPLSSVSHE